MTAPILAAVELGGTKTIVALGHSPDRMLQHSRFSTERFTAPANSV